MLYAVTCEQCLVLMACACRARHGVDPSYRSHAEHMTISKNTTAGRQVSQSSKMFAICSVRGCCWLNSSIASPIYVYGYVTVLSEALILWVMWSWTIEMECWFTSDYWKTSAEQLVKGRVHRMLISALMFRSIDVACLRAAATGR